MELNVLMQWHDAVVRESVRSSVARGGTVLQCVCGVRACVPPVALRSTLVLIYGLLYRRSPGVSVK